MHLKLCFYSFEMNEYICIVVHIILMYWFNPKLFDEVDRNRAKERLVILKLIYIQKFAQTQTLIC